MSRVKGSQPGRLQRSRETLRQAGDPPISGRNVGSPDPLKSTRNISSSPFCFSAVSPVSQGQGLRLGTWVGKVLPQLALPPPGSGESHGTCPPAAGNHTLRWKTERKGGE